MRGYVWIYSYEELPKEVDFIYSGERVNSGKMRSKAASKIIQGEGKGKFTHAQIKNKLTMVGPIAIGKYFLIGMIKHVASSLEVTRARTDSDDDKPKYHNKLDISYDRIDEVYREALAYAATINNRVVDEDDDDEYEDDSDEDEDDDDDEDESSSNYSDASIKSDCDEDEEGRSEMDDFVQDDDDPLEYYESSSSSSEEFRRKKKKEKKRKSDKKAFDRPVMIDLVDNDNDPLEDYEQSSSSEEYRQKKRNRSDKKMNDRQVLIDLVDSPPLLRIGGIVAKPTAINLSVNPDNVRIMKKRKVDRNND